MKQYTYIINILLIIFIAAGCGVSDKNNNDSLEASGSIEDRIRITKEQFDKSGMILGKLEERSFPEIVSTTGMIDVPPQKRAVVSAIVGGFIKNTPLLVGDKVKKGQALLTIENPEYVTMQQEYLEVKEQLTYLESEYKRQQLLLKEKITSQKKFLKAESDYKMAKALYSGLQKRLSMLNISTSQVEKGTITSVATIFAPLEGSITKMNIVKGMYVSQATEMLEIIDNDHIHLELSVFEKDIMSIRKGQEIKFKIPEVSNNSYEASVYLIGSAIDANRTIRVHGHLKENTKYNFLTGMYVNASIITERNLAKSLPETAVIEVEGKYYVFVLDNKNNDGYHFSKVEVFKDKTFEGFVALKNTSSLKDTDQILTQGAFSLISNLLL